MTKIKSIEQLESLYDKPLDIVHRKVIDHINPHYQQFIEASPFLILSTMGEHGLDSSPRGDPKGFVRVVNQNELLIPDRRGNNLTDSLRNIIFNPQVCLIFIIPNVGETIRVSGTAEIINDPSLNQSFAINDKAATSVIRVHVNKALFQCQKAIVRSKLWDSSCYIDRQLLPTAGKMAQHFSKQVGIEFDGEAYDQNYPERMKKNIY